jgi:hypothetical protein
VLAHPPYSADLAPCNYWVFAYMKEYLEGKQFESEGNINTAVTAPLHHPSKDEYRTASDCLPHRWEKSMDSAGDYMEKRTNMYTCRNREISVVLLSCIVLL